MKMTLNQYIKNPMNSSVFTAAMRETMHSDYNRRFGALMLREHGRIATRIFRDEKNNKYYAYFKIPSETIEKFYYDVVIEFYTDEDVKSLGTNLFDYNVRFFSNDPAFNYTYAYSFNVNDLIIANLKSKMSKKAIKTEAKEKNPSNQIGYVKTIYFAYLYMQSKGINSINTANAMSEKMSIQALRNLIEDTDQKIDNREAEGIKLQRKKSREKKQEDRRKEAENKTDNTKAVKTAKTIGTTKVNNKNIKSVSKIKRK